MRIAFGILLLLAGLGLAGIGVFGLSFTYFLNWIGFSENNTQIIVGLISSGILVSGSGIFLLAKRSKRPKNSISEKEE